MSKHRVNCWKPEMAISSQAAQKCAEGSETRLYSLTGLYANLSVEFKGDENPRAPDKQTVQEVWTAKAHSGVLCERAMQNVLASKMRGVPESKETGNSAIFAELV